MVKRRAAFAAALLALSAVLTGCATQSPSPRMRPLAPAPTPLAQTFLQVPLAGAGSVERPQLELNALVQHPMLTQVQMLGPFGGWAIEQLLHGTAIARTVDGGRSWSTVYVSPRPATQLSAANMQTAYVLLSPCSGTACPTTVLVATHNGGATWNTVYTTQGFTAKALSFIQPNIGYLAGTVPATSGGTGSGALLVTSSGGQTFTTLSSPCSSPSVAVMFLSAAQGYMLCGGPANTDMQGKSLFRTSDGGTIWTLVSSVAMPQAAGPVAPGSGLPLAGRVHTIFFTSATQGYIGLDRGGIYETTDGGIHWNPVWQPPFAPGADDAFSVGFTDPLHGWVLYGEGPPLSTTSNGGRTWNVVYPPLSPATSLSFSTPLRGVGAGWVYDGTLILATTDGGAHWTMAARAPVDISALSVVGPQTYLVLGQSALYRTEDGGATWAAFPPPRGYYPAALGVQNADVGYLIAYKPAAGRTLFSTVDGGKTWQPMPTPFAPASIAVSSQGTVLAVGQPTQPAIAVHSLTGPIAQVSLRTADPYLWILRGGRWWPVRVPAWRSGDPLPIGLQAGSHGLLWMWSQSQIWVSTNFGGLWQPINFRDQLAISDVSFSGPLNGYILTAGNDVYSTADGGHTWQLVSGSPTY